MEIEVKIKFLKVLSSPLNSFKTILYLFIIHMLPMQRK